MHTSSHNNPEVQRQREQLEYFLQVLPERLVVLAAKLRVLDIDDRLELYDLAQQLLLWNEVFRRFNKAVCNQGVRNLVRDGMEPPEEFPIERVEKMLSDAGL